MLTYRFKNLTFKHEGMDFLGNGIAHYVIEDYEEDGKQAAFEDAELFDALGKDGYVLSKECLGYLSDSVVATLNQDSHLCRVIASRTF